MITVIGRVGKPSAPAAFETNAVEAHTARASDLMNFMLLPKI
jgi:hypothetical protein